MMILCTEHSEVGLRLLFGPQCSEIEDSITHIRDAVLKDPTALGFLSELIDQLPSLWPVITDAWPALDQLSGEKQLAALGQLFEDRLSSSCKLEASNLILTPVTVMRHIVDFWTLQHVARHPVLPSLSSQTAALRVIDTQGFCVGILAAIAVACSRNICEFQAMASNAIRLAVCIGALVDLDEIVSGNTTSMAVQWESLQDYDHLERMLKQDPSVSFSQ